MISARSFAGVVVHPDQHRRADRAAHQNDALARIGIVDRLPAGLRDVRHGEAVRAFGDLP